ncbi:MAG: tRNA lysidine(34) synthetase TilS, partial [Bacteroidales bacterium]|nr:tRNA lysidine(34) synthetase TilS [Bacteroidales bacterium]
MEKLQFEETIRSYIRQNGMFEPSAKILVALSGGADSVALLLVLRRLGYECVAAHCNFHLRGQESNRDEAFARSLCKNMDVELHVKDFDVESYRQEKGVSVEMACRELRYEWFFFLLQKNDIKSLAVAHHADDNIETMFLNLFRGTGITGIAGIKPVANMVCRPLLCVQRTDIEQYLQDCGQGYVNDSTNFESEFKRNKLRNVVLPKIYEEFPDSKKGLMSSSVNFLDNMLLLNHLTDIAKKELVERKNGCEISIDFDKMIALHKQCADSLLYEMIKQYGFTALQCRNLVESDKHSGLKVHAGKYMALFTSHSLDIVE